VQSRVRDDLFFAPSNVVHIDLQLVSQKDFTSLMFTISQLFFSFLCFWFQTVRQMCVNYMQENQDMFEPFVASPGLSWDHYLFEMRKVFAIEQCLTSLASVTERKVPILIAFLGTICFFCSQSITWAGQVEMSALGSLLKTNFRIYSLGSAVPTDVDFGFNKYVELCFYSNHYDVVLPQSRLETEKFCQGIQKKKDTILAH
jgi:hypothetical protein